MSDRAGIPIRVPTSIATLEVLQEDGKTEIYTDVSWSTKDRELKIFHANGSPLVSYSAIGWLRARVVTN